MGAAAPRGSMREIDEMIDEAEVVAARTKTQPPASDVTQKEVTTTTVAGTKDTPKGGGDTGDPGGDSDGDSKSSSV